MFGSRADQQHWSTLHCHEEETITPVLHLLSRHTYQANKHVAPPNQPFHSICCLRLRYHNVFTPSFFFVLKTVYQIEKNRLGESVFIYTSYIIWLIIITIIITIVIVIIIIIIICGLQLPGEPHRSTRLLHLTSRWQYDGIMRLASRSVKSNNVDFLKKIRYFSIK